MATTAIVGIAIIFVVGFIFYAEISSGISSFLSDQDLQTQNDALDIKPDENTLARTMAVINIVTANNTCPGIISYTLLNKIMRH